MLVPNRHGSSNSYRYGFNGKEKDDEVKGQGVQYDYGFRVYDARIGKFLSMDPLFKDFEELTPYQYASNTPIRAIDLDGLEAVDAQSKNVLKDFKTSQEGDLITLEHNFNLNKPSLKLTTYFSTSGEGEAGFSFKAIFGRRPALGLLEGLVRGPNDHFSYEVANRDKIKGNYAEISITGIGNTFRHFLLNVVLTSTLGDKWAKHISDIKERKDISKDGLTLDNSIDLINNAWGRHYAKNNNIILKDVLKDKKSTASFLNDVSVYMLNSIEEYKNDKAYADIISGKIKLFNENSKIVEQFMQTAKAFMEYNESYLTEPNKNKENESK